MYDIITKAEFRGSPTNKELTSFCEDVVGSVLARGMIMTASYSREDGEILLKFRTNEMEEIIEPATGMLFMSFRRNGITPTVARIISKKKVDTDSFIKVLLSSEIS